MEYIKVIQKPDMDLYPAIEVDKNTTLEYKNDHVEQTLKNLKFKSITKVKGDNYLSTYITTIRLKKGDILIFENEERGYIFPVEKFMKVNEVIEELKPLMEV